MNKLSTIVRLCPLLKGQEETVMAALETIFPSKTQRSAEPKRACQHGQLKKGEVLKLENKDQTLRVLAGLAWLTQRGIDIFVPQGEEVELTSGSDSIVMSGLGNVPLDYEIV